jgi:hypothetical protein
MLPPARGAIEQPQIVGGGAPFDRFVDESDRYERSSAVGLNDIAAKRRIVAEVRRSAVDR